MPIQLTSIQHIGIPVTDIARSEAFYKKLGFEQVMASSFMHSGARGEVVMMQSGAIVLELYQMPESALQEIRMRKNGHIDHIAFDVEDIDSVFEVLKTAGYDIVESEPIYLPFWRNGCRYFNMLGPDGERLEFNQILK